MASSPEAAPGPDAVAGSPQAYRYRARAWWGDDVVADSTATLRLDRPGHSPSLWFPCTDVRWERFEEVTLGPALGAPLRCWSVPGDPAGEAVVSSHPDAGHEASWAKGFVTFDHDRVRVELVDAGPSDDERDVTVKRFPTWGDAADLIDLLDVRQEDDATWVAGARSDWRRPVVEGSQMLGQAVVAASRHSAGRRIVSAHLVFPRVADARRAVRVHLDEVSAGRTFTTLGVRVTQRERCVAVGTLLLDETADDLIRHTEPGPAVPTPYGSEPYDMGVTGRDLRIVDGAYTGDPNAPVGPPDLDAWVRFRDVPGDPALHAGLLAQFTGHLSIAAALRPHAGVGQHDAHRTLSTAINAIGLSFHAPIRADRWLLYHHHSTFAGDGMTRAEGHVHDGSGDLVASFTVDAMVRAFPDGDPTPDPRVAL